MKHTLFLLIILLVIKINAFSQRVDVSLLNPTLTSSPEYAFTRFGNTSTFWGGLMWNNNSPTYGNGNDFTIFTYDNRDLVLQARLGNIILFPDLSSGNVGIGTTSPNQKLHIRGRMVLDPLDGEQPILFTGTGTSEQNRYLSLLNSASFSSASGLKAGGLLISDSYSYANPAKNDVVVKGNVGIGTGTVSTYSKMTLQNASGSFLNLISTSGTSEILLGADQNGGIISTMTDHDLILRAGGNINRMIVKANGNIGIGTNNPGENQLAVNGTIKAKEVKVTLSDWPDYVFESSYALPTLEEVESHIKEKGHLKDIPSATDVEENGVNLGEMDAMLLKKIEELTLYMIDLKKENEKLKEENIEIKNVLQVVLNK